MSHRFLNFSYRFAVRDPQHDVYPAKSRGPGGLPWEGFEKARWLHHTLGVPATWIVDSEAILRAGGKLADAVGSNGDEIILLPEALGTQPFYEKIGIKQTRFGLRSYSRRELVTLFAGLRKLAQDELGLDVRIGAGFWYTGDAIAAAEEAGFEAMWGLCWDQQNIDGATHRGSPWFPYYASTTRFDVPSAGQRGVLMLPWYAADLGNAFLFNLHPPFTTHCGELARWCIRYPREYVRAILTQYAAEAATSPFSLVDFHLECDWFDSSGLYNDEGMSPAVEVWAMQKECVADSLNWDGWKPRPLQEFVTWHRGQFATTTRHEQWWTDPLGNFPPLRFVADASALQVYSTAGELLAEQAYEDGQALPRRGMFDDRAALRAKLAPSIRLPLGLSRRVAAGSKDPTLLATGTLIAQH